MSQSSLSRATEAPNLPPLSQVAISKIEAGRSTSIQADTLFRLAAALQCNPAWLRDGIGDPFQLSHSPDTVAEATELLAKLSPERQAMILAAIRAISAD